MQATVLQIETLENVLVQGFGIFLKEDHKTGYNVSDSFEYQEIKALFPSDCNPFYAGFGNRDTDEISYLKVGIPKGKIFIINPKVVRGFLA